jgi:hypothetical protein
MPQYIPSIHSHQGCFQPLPRAPARIPPKNHAVAGEKPGKMAKLGPAATREIVNDLNFMVLFSNKGSSGKKS